MAKKKEKELTDLEKRQADNTPKRQKKPINYSKLILVFMFSVYILLQVFQAVKDAKPSSGDLTYTTLFEMLDNDEVETVKVTKESDICKVVTKSGETFEIVNPKSDTFIEDMMKHGANISVQKMRVADSITSMFLMLPLMAILAMFALYLMNTVIGGSTKMFTMLKPGNNHTGFKDIRGNKKTQKDLQFAVDQLRKSKDLAAMGARPSKGILLYGPPGTGKTMTARAIANEAGVPFISCAGSDFSEMFVGVGAGRVRSLFTLAFENAPCIVFIDEIDCFGKRRMGGDGASQDHNQTLNAFLQKLDGLEKNPGVLVIGATNRKEALDDALLRPGRFDKHYYIGPPSNKEDRDDIVSYYLENKKLDEGTTLDKVSKLCVGLTGAEIEEVTNEAVFLSIADDRDGKINVSDVDEAVMKLGTSGVKEEHSSERDMIVSAYHEAGHAVTYLLNNIPLLKVSVARYSSGPGGVTVKDLDKTFDTKLEFKSEVENDIQGLLSGMISEDIKFGQHTQGCSSDIEMASSRAYGMVAAYAQADNMFNEHILIENGLPDVITENTKKECNKILKANKDIAFQKLTENYELVEKLAQKLLVEKTIVAPTLEEIRGYSLDESKEIKIDI